MRLTYEQAHELAVTFTAIARHKASCERVCKEANHKAFGWFWYYDADFDEVCLCRESIELPPDYQEDLEVKLDF